MNLIKNIFQGDKVIWIVFLMLCLISITEVFSASSTLVYQSGDHWGPITRHCIFLLVGAGVVVLFHATPFKWFRVLPLLLLPPSLVFLVMLLLCDRLNLGGMLVIEKVNEASRWVKFMGIQFQPSELAKMGVVIVVAFILSKGQDEEGAHPKAFRHILIVSGLFCGLILPENYSTAVLLFATVFLMMFIGRVALRKLLALGGLMLLVGSLFVAFLWLTPNETLKEIPLGGRFTTWKSRLAEFSEPKVPPQAFDIDEKGQVGHARIAVATSNVLGKGPGNSVQRDFLSQAYSDFIYAIVIEELGLAGALVVAFLYVVLLIRVGRIARKCDRTFPAFLVLGIGLIVVTQALFNMMVAVGLAPVTGQPLPLVSRGGTSTFINCAYVGMILSVSRYTQALQKETTTETAPEAIDDGPPDGLKP
ncbi:MAG: FtsW/RodA/SpoVE family cell cycle protein [Bacteroides sp.]|nr:FtsW/RodA/SpoVE family cell cycle protein [Bacteroides sp.]